MLELNSSHVKCTFYFLFFLEKTTTTITDKVCLPVTQDMLHLFKNVSYTTDPVNNVNKLLSGPFWCLRYREGSHHLIMSEFFELTLIPFKHD